MAKILIFQVVNFDYFFSKKWLFKEWKKNSLNCKSRKRWFILDSETKLILELENINTKNSRNVLTAKYRSILTILHWMSKHDYIK